MRGVTAGEEASPRGDADLVGRLPRLEDAERRVLHRLGRTVHGRRPHPGQDPLNPHRLSHGRAARHGAEGTAGYHMVAVRWQESDEHRRILHPLLEVSQFKPAPARASDRERASELPENLRPGLASGTEAPPSETHPQMGLRMSSNITDAHKLAKLR